MKPNKMQHKAVILKTRGKKGSKPYDCLGFLYETLCRQQCREGNVSKVQEAPSVEDTG